MPLDRGGGVKLKTQWLPVAASLENKEASLLLLSLYMGKLMGVGQRVGEVKVRLSSGHVVVENRLLGRADQGWVVGEGMVVVVNNLEERVSLEVVDVQRDKVLGEAIVKVAEDSAALVKMQWGKTAEVSSSCNLFPKLNEKTFSRNMWRFATKLFPLHNLWINPSPKSLEGPVSIYFRSS